MRHFSCYGTHLLFLMRSRCRPAAARHRPAHTANTFRGERTSVAVSKYNLNNTKIIVRFCNRDLIGVTTRYL